MELEGVRKISEAKCLMGVIRRSDKEYGVFRDLEGFAVPLEDRKSRRKSANERIVFTLLSHRRFVPPQFFFIAPIDPCAQAIGDELCTEAYPQSRVPLYNPAPHELLLL